LSPEQTSTPTTASAPPAASKNPYICIADSAAVTAGSASTAPLYVTAPFESNTPPPEVVRAWRSHLAAQYHLTTDSANCSRRNQAQRNQLEQRLAKANGRVVRVDWKP